MADKGNLDGEYSIGVDKEQREVFIVMPERPMLPTPEDS